MAMQATVQIRMDKDLKDQVELLYKKMGTSFSEAVRMFATQSLAEGKMPFVPALKSWDQLTEKEIDNMIMKSREDVKNSRTYSLEEIKKYVLGA